MRLNNNIPKKQRALVLQGGGALGAYEAGVLKILCKKLAEEDKQNGEEGRLVFDIVAGTSIGAMNGAILVSQFLQTQSWEIAAKKLEKFWTEQLSLKCLDISELSKPWYDEWMKRNPTAASEEAARRYYSVKKLIQNQAQNNMYYRCDPVYDNRFFDNLYLDKGPNDDNPNCKDPNCKKPNFLNNFWLPHSNKPLQESIEKYAIFPIATTFLDKNNHKRRQPRLLVFSVDVAEGAIVIFDSYPKADVNRKSEYGKYIKEKGEYETIVNYNDGIDIKHVMASGTIPEFYYYAEVPMQSTNEQKNQDERCVPNKCNKDRMRYFWDGGILSNTPLRELLQAHQEYWIDINNNDRIPDLDVYIVNVHPPKMKIDMIPQDYDGVKDRHNDIKYGDRTSHYDENMAHLTADYNNFVRELEKLTECAISKVNDKHLQERFQHILKTETRSKDRKGEARRYEDLIGEGFKLTEVIRIERTNYINSLYGKGGDLTFETIDKLIKEGKCDAWFSLIQKDIQDMELFDDSTDIRDILIHMLNEAVTNLRDNDYEDNNSQIYHKLTNFIHEVEKNNDKLKSNQSTKLIRSADAFMAIIDKI